MEIKALVVDNNPVLLRAVSAILDQEGCIVQTAGTGIEALEIIDDFCPDMVRQGKLPDCVTACPNGVFYFGDQNEDTVTNGDETVQLSKLLKDRSGYRYAEELGTEPSVYYLPPVNRLFPYERGFKNLNDEQKSRYGEFLNDES